MKKLKNFLFILLFTLFSLSLSGKNFENSKNLISGKLENGIHYYIYKNNKPENKAMLNLVVKTGSLMEEDNEQGIAHFMEHMAFNGTTKFEKNEMIKYLQSIGLSFGGDLNAYTSFDRTVYKLLVPTTPKELEDGIEVLREWASEATLSPQEIDSEKKVVIEEWRLRQGLAQRLGDVQKKALFEGSRYFDRFPIGLPEIINGADQNLVKGFYQKWYQPENISIVAVGDFNINQVETFIHKYFNYQGTQKGKTPKEYSLKKLKNKYVAFSDDEIRYNTFTITKILDRDVIKDEKSMKNSIIDQLLFNILNTRLNNLQKESDTPFLQSLVYKYDINNSQDIFSAVAVIKNNKLSEGITLLNNFLKSSAKNGVTDYELELEKENLINNYKNLVTNKESITHETYADSLVEHVMSGECFIDIDEEFNIYSTLIKNITTKDLNKRIKKIYKENSLYFLTTSTSQNKINEKQLEELIKESKNSNKIIDFSIKPVILTPLKTSLGSFTKETDGKYLLSNGIKVFSKKTDFDKDKIYIKLFKKEGSSSNDYTTFINSTIAPTIIEQSGVGNLKPTDIDTFMKGKNFSISSYISDYEQGFIISTDRKNLELALEYMNYLIYEPKVDKIIYENTISDLKESLNNRNNSPQIVYRDKIREIYSGKNNRKLPLSEKDLTLISPEKVLNIYKEKFSNFSEYNLIVVGSFNEEELEKNLKTYVASLPSENSKTIITPLDLKTPKNIVKEKIIKGVDKKATVTLIFPYNFKYGYEEKTLYNSFSQILNIALIEDIREKIGGVYSISSRTSLSPNNYGEDKMVISYSCDISRVDEIEKAVLQSLESLLYKDIDKEKINSVVKNYELSYNTEMKENSFWFNYLYQKITVPNYKLATPEEYKELVTKENIWKVNRKAINLKNYISVTLIPEKEEI
ncbi:M16 family metallopeptidase [uncultured Fusobacterium sp.]|uniref:M16 family metallopeptidase n=1 Tax=uncultured Fusobacterium sp. TaxID=159267 RepID=UPI0025F30D72|nr:M16 family metallopeptidase [uncultured Fusobacterium sp.]